MEENNEKQYVVGIDVGGQTSKLGVVDARGTVLAQTDTARSIRLSFRYFGENSEEISFCT